MNLNKQSILEALERLAVMYKPQTPDLSRLAEMWGTALSGLTPDQIRLGVETYIRSDARFFPKAGQIRKMAQESGARLDRVKAATTPADAACPTCKATEGPIPGSTRWGVVHDHETHYRAGVAYAGVRTGPSLEGRMLAPGAQGDTPYLTPQEHGR